MVIARKRGNIGAPCGGWAPCSVTFRRTYHPARDGVVAPGQMAAPVAGDRLPAVLPPCALSPATVEWRSDKWRRRLRGHLLPVLPYFLTVGEVAFGQMAASVADLAFPCATARWRSDKMAAPVAGHWLLAALPRYDLPSLA